MTEDVRSRAIELLREARYTVGDLVAAAALRTIRPVIITSDEDDVDRLCGKRQGRRSLSFRGHLTMNIGRHRNARSACPPIRRNQRIAAIRLATIGLHDRACQNVF
ncbi:hypothetical protein AB0B45_24915 [Nonomuraea sp. NPDC049152]|uniref:hypothetical protein n=1 Tax=Nonomuraea sp. NPDC049152 TaxID=3154350 RepID=UPI0033D44EDF